MRNEVIYDKNGRPDIMVVFTPSELGLPDTLRGRKVKEYAISKYQNTLIDGVPYSLPFMKPGMDRVAFMQQYTPMYEREKSRSMTPAQLTEKIDNAAGSLPDKGQRLIEYRESERRRKEQEMEAITRGALRLESQIVEQTKLELRGEVLG